MKLENCIKCEYHEYYQNCQVLCKYKNITVSNATTRSEDKKNEIIVLSCPKDN